MAYTVLVVAIMSLHVYMYICMHANKISQGLGHRASPLVNKLGAEVITSMLAALTIEEPTLDPDAASPTTAKKEPEKPPS